MKCPKKEEELGPGIVLALHHKVKNLKSFLTKRVVIKTRKSQRKALNSLVTNSVRSSEGVKRRVLLHEEEDLIFELRRTRPTKVVGTEKEEDSMKHDDELFIFSLIIWFGLVIADDFVMTFLFCFLIWG